MNVTRSNDGFSGIISNAASTMNDPASDGSVSRRNRPSITGSVTLLAIVMACAAWTNPLRAETIHLPNGSFESPSTAFADPRIDSWQKSPQPVWFDPATFGGTWDQLSGVFLNSPVTDPSHIDNVDGSQAAFLFALPQVALFQDYTSTDWNHPTPTHAFDARFTPGRSYHLTVGVIGGGGGMTNGATMQISLYYRDAASNMVTVAATTITNSPATFSTNTHLIDFQVNSPAVTAGDPWAGQNIGVQLLSTAGFDQIGGYWDLDNVRLTEIVEPALESPTAAVGQFQFTLRSEPGLGFEILSTTNLSLPLSNWTTLETVTNVTGVAPVVDAAAGSAGRFYQARRLP